MNINSRRIKTINLLCYTISIIISAAFLGVTKSNVLDLKITLYILMLIGTIVVFGINLSDKSSIELVSRFNVIAVVFSGCVSAWAACSPLALLAFSFLAAVLAFYNGKKRPFIEHAVLTIGILWFVYTYPIICSANGWNLDPNFIVVDLQETIISSVLIAFTDLFLVSIIIKDRRQKDAYFEQEKTTDELLKIIETKADEAKNATKSKSDFLASMSHEIRTPINSVLGMNEMILRETKEEFTREYAHDIQNSSNMLLALINNILDFSKIESGKMQIIPVTYDVSALLNDMVVMVSSRAASKSLAIKLVVDPDLPRVLKGDEIRLKQIITNILSNAVKYTDTGYVQMSVGFRKIDERSINFEVSVKDTGCGMKQEDLGKLFAPFERIEELRNRHVEGTGLGMTITRQILALMGSDLHVESTYGAGSEFSFNIVQDVIDWQEIGDYEEAFKKLKTSQDRDNTEKFIAPEAKVLVVDDIQLNLNVFSNLLKRTKIQVDTALSGEAAIAKARENSYHVIFMDHMMPDMDGVETLNRIRKDRFSLCRSCPVVALTANAVSGAREFYIEKGFVDYLSKPVNPARLEIMVGSYIPDELKQEVESKPEENTQIKEKPLHEEKGEISSELETTISEETTEDKLRKIDVIDVDEGINYTGDIDNYIEMAEEFYNTVISRADMIENYWQEGDLQNFTIQVHALKSTARLIGAMDISERALKLEEAGRNGDSDFINENTPTLLDKYYELHGILGKIFAKNDAEELPTIPNEELESIIADVKDGFENFDFEKMENSVKKLSLYKLPEDKIQALNKLKSLVADVAIEEIGMWLEEN